MLKFTNYSLFLKAVWHLLVMVVSKKCVHFFVNGEAISEIV